jgi:hypothetical protein
MRILVFLTTFTLTVQAQWTLRDAHTTADLRGIDSIGKSIAWVSGTSGTILRTDDGGYSWQKCNIPPGADTLDFRGIQAFDSNTAIVISSGKGDLSRLYKTSDGCRTWTLVLENPDKEGFWDAIRFDPDSKLDPSIQFGVLVGDPVDGSFVIYLTHDAGSTWSRWRNDKTQKPAHADKGEALFAASNSALLVPGDSGRRSFAFVTGGKSSRIFLSYCENPFNLGTHCDFQVRDLGFDTGDSLGAFAIATGAPSPRGKVNRTMVVGGDYKHSQIGYSLYIPWFQARSLWLLNPTPSKRLFSPRIPPHGYRSAIEYDAVSKTWITVGPNGTDISTDFGAYWSSLKPGPGDAPDADQHWNALSLPFVVGPKGRIGILHSDALPKAAAK